MYTPTPKESDSMDKRERFIVKNIYGANWQDWLDPYNKKVLESDRERAQRIKAMLPAYYVVTMRTSLKWYEYKPNGMSWDEYHRTIKSQKPKTDFMSMTFFRIKDYTPASRTAGFFTAPKCILPSLKLETLDGRTIEAYSEYIKDGKQYVVLSDELLGEVKKNFVHPRLNLDNYSGYSTSYVVGDESHTTYFESQICTKQQAAQMYGQWKEGRQSLKEHFDRVFERQAQERRQKDAAEQQRNQQQNRYVNQFEKDFRGW